MVLPSTLVALTAKGILLRYKSSTNLSRYSGLLVGVTLLITNNGLLSVFVLNKSAINFSSQLTAKPLVFQNGRKALLSTLTPYGKVF